MFHPDTIPKNADSEANQMSRKQEAAIPKEIEETVVSAETPKLESLAGFAMKEENKLSPDMSPDEIENLAGKFVEVETAKREEAARKLFFEQLAEQRAMLQEEILRNSIITGDNERNGGEGEKTFSQDAIVSSKPGTFEWIASKLEYVPGGKKLLGALALVAGLSAMPKEAMAGNSWFEGLVRNTISETVRDYQYETRRKRMEQEQKQRKAESEAKQYQREMERMKDQYARESQRVVDQYDREDSSIERSYVNGQMSMESRRGDAAQKERMRNIIDVAYHKDKLKAAERAWNSMSRVKEKYIYISTSGVSYMSKVNEEFLKNLQRVATKEVQELAKLGETGVVTIIPLLEIPSEQMPTQREDAAPQQERLTPSESGTRVNEVSGSESRKVDLDKEWHPGYGADTWGKIHPDDK